MKASEIHQLSDEELQTEHERLRRHLFDVRSQAVTEKLEDPSMLTKTKRDIARILTIMRQRELEAERSVAQTETNGTPTDV
ncbi:MAG TPA: 50S ribosomal protein L29 [Phycisphaerae bacterium]|nr:50S ribosomal protein L29 [Phycisphaerae bacterium]